MSGVSGDLGKLAAFRAKVGKLIGIPERIAPAVAVAFKGLAATAFATSTDPYGAAWTPLKKPTHAPLVKTGRMRDDLGFNPFGARVKVLLGAFYTRFHISTGRRFLPKPGQLPPSYRAVIDREATAEFKRTAGQ